ncbi:MAG: helix-turn-helix domain-containing protein [Frankiaceae bacterium]|nr:helix-turn-helix domain-containing protein [Frankiaceae bacterium]
MLVVDGVDVMEVREAAAYVGRTPETVRRWVWSQRVSSVRRGNRLLIPKHELDAALGRSSGPSAGPVPSLREWAAGVPRLRVGPGSAADLVIEDRWSDDHSR